MSKLLQQIRLDILVQKFRERTKPATPSADLRKVVVPKPITTKAGR